MSPLAATIARHFADEIGAVLKTGQARQAGGHAYQSICRKTHFNDHRVRNGVEHGEHGGLDNALPGLLPPAPVRRLLSVVRD
jgi:hypothetical protein